MDFIPMSDLSPNLQGANVARSPLSLFATRPDQLKLTACIVGEDRCWSGQTLKNDDQLAYHLADLQLDLANSSRVFAVKSPNSRTRLNITASQYKSLLETIHAFAEATELIESFTVDATDFYVGRGSISFGPATLLDATSGVRLEFCALLKFVEPNTRGTTSIRQMGIYHSYSEREQSEISLLINPSTLAWNAVRTRLAGGSQTWRHWSCLPLIIFKTLPSGWTDYIRGIHQKVFDMHMKVSFLGVPDGDDVRKGIGSFRIVEVDEIKAIARYKDELKYAEHALTTNIETLKEYLREADRRIRHNSADSEHQASCLGIHGVVRELEFERRQTAVVSYRLDQIAASYQNIASTINSDRMAEMTMKTIKEAHAVRLIALATFCFLPPSLTCVSTMCTHCLITLALTWVLRRSSSWAIYKLMAPWT